MKDFFLKNLFKNLLLYGYEILAFCGSARLRKINEVYSEMWFCYS